MKLLTTLILALLSCLISFAQDFYVQGIVTDSIGETEPYATIKIYCKADTLKPAAIDLTDSDGAFKISLPAPADYTLHVAAVGKCPFSIPFSLKLSQPSANLGTIQLKDSSTSLNEVTVSAQRPLVSKEIDRIGYDVQADDQAKTSPIIEILKKVPLVLVQPDGTILVNGSSNYKIYRNGRPNASYSQNAKELFKSIPASSIKKIEVITDPGAREDAEGVGAILNIVTMENTGLRGVAGNVSVAANTIERLPNNLSASLTTQIDKFTISPYVGYFRSKRSNRSEDCSETTFLDTGDKMSSFANSESQYSSCYWGFDSSLELDTLNLFTIEYSGNSFTNKNSSEGHNALTSANGDLVYSYDSFTDMPKGINSYHSFSANYQRSTHRKDETLTLSYQLDLGNSSNESSNTYSDMVNSPVPYTGIINISNNHGTEQTLQFDWSRPYGAIHKLDLGAKYIHRYSHSENNITYIGANDVNTDFAHTTQVAALYADYRAKFDKFGLRAGARYEYSHLGGEYKTGNTPKFASDFNDIVPNLAVSYNINDANTLKFSYSMRIARPGIYYLNPTVNSTPNSVSSGNPHLHSAKYNGLILNYSFMKPKINIDFTTTYQFSDNGIVNVENAVNNIMYSTVENVGKSRTFAFSLYAQWMIAENSSLSFNGSASYRKYQNPASTPGAWLTNSGWNGYGYARFSQRLPWKLRANLSLNYWSGGLYSVYSKSMPVGAFAFDHAISLQRSFLSDDRLTVQLSASNPFGPYTGSYKSTSFNSGSEGISYNKDFHNAYASLRVSYRFGSLKATVKKTKGITNDDKQSESSKGGK